ncbi:hypothetical protein A2U01_0085414, partial [Trifolium medium]|nr:hypothetical protein [Trifolium medium]
MKKRKLKPKSVLNAYRENSHRNKKIQGRSLSHFEELEAGLAGLDMEEEKPCPDLDITDIKEEDLWVRRWGRFRK